MRRLTLIISYPVNLAQMRPQEMLHQMAEELLQFSSRESWRIA